MGAATSTDSGGAKLKPDDNSTPLLSSKSDGAPKEWKASLCSCMEYPGVNVCAFYAPCFRFAQTAVRARMKPNWGFVFWFVLYLFGFLLFFCPLLWPWCSAAWPLKLSSTAYETQIWFPWCAIWYLSLPTIVAVGAWKRYEIRRKYNIKAYGGEDCGAAEDCCLHFWCEPCALAQEAVEVDLQELGVAVASASMGERD